MSFQPTGYLPVDSSLGLTMVNQALRVGCVIAGKVFMETFFDGRRFREHLYGEQCRQPVRHPRRRPARKTGSG